MTEQPDTTIADTHPRTWRFMEMALPWLQWSALIFIACFAVIDAQSDHGFQMAFNCMLIGFVAGSMLFAKYVSHMRKYMEEYRRLLDQSLIECDRMQEKYLEQLTVFHGGINAPLVPPESLN